MIASHFGEALLSLPLHLSSESSLGTPWSDCIGAPNGSLPQNICSLGKSLLAGRFRKNNMSLEGKCCWDIDNSGCIRGFDV